jgi:hypothetical protein
MKDASRCALRRSIGKISKWPTLSRIVAISLLALNRQNPLRTPCYRIVEDVPLLFEAMDFYW